MSKYKLTQKTDANGTTQDLKIDASCLDAVASIGGKNGAITLGSGLSITNGGELFTTGTGAKIVDLGTITFPYTLTTAQYDEVESNGYVILTFTQGSTTFYYRKTISYSTDIAFEYVSLNSNSSTHAKQLSSVFINKSTKVLASRYSNIFIASTGITYNENNDNLSIDESKVVTIDTTQSITGAKTFTQDITINDTTNGGRFIKFQSSGTTRGQIINWIDGGFGFHSPSVFFSTLSDSDINKRLYIDSSATTPVIRPYGYKTWDIGSASNSFNNLYGNLVAIQDSFSYDGCYIKNKAFGLGEYGGGTASVQGLGCYKVGDKNDDWVSIVETRATNYQSSVIPTTNLHLGIKQATDSTKANYRYSFIDLNATSGDSWISFDTNTLVPANDKGTSIGWYQYIFNSIWGRNCAVRYDYIYNGNYSTDAGYYGYDINGVNVGGLIFAKDSTWNAWFLDCRDKDNSTKRLEFVRYSQSGNWNYDPIESSNGVGVNLGTSSRRWANIYLNNSPNVSSDIRDKADIEEVEHALDFILKVKPITYVDNMRTNYINLDEDGKQILNENDQATYNEEEYLKQSKKGTRRQVGVSAQQTYEALQECYKSDNYAKIVNINNYNGNHPEMWEQYSVSYERFVPFLIKAIQEQQAQIEDLKQQLNNL